MDQGQFAQAIESIDAQRRRIEDDPQLDATVKLARKASLAMLSFEACSLASDAAADKNRAAQASFASQRFDALAALAAESGDSRQGIYQMVGDRLEEVAGVAGLPPFAKAVYAARWIRERKFEQALGAADSLDRDEAARSDFLKQDAVFFKAACLQELNQPLPAAQEYLRFSRDYGRDKRAPQAMLTGLSLLAKQQDVLEDATTRGLLTDVGDMLLRSSDPQVEKYRQAWLPLVAEANLREGRYDRAAELFGVIPKDSRQYGLAVVGRILAVSGKLRFAAAASEKDKARAEAEAVIREAVELAGKVADEPVAAATSRAMATQPAGPNVLAARLLLEAARLSIDTLGDADRALKLLEGAEGRWRQDPALLAEPAERSNPGLGEGGQDRPGEAAGRAVHVGAAGRGGALAGAAAGRYAAGDRAAAEARAERAGGEVLGAGGGSGGAAGHVGGGTRGRNDAGAAVCDPVPAGALAAAGGPGRAGAGGVRGPLSAGCGAVGRAGAGRGGAGGAGELFVRPAEVARGAAGVHGHSGAGRRRGARRGGRRSCGPCSVRCSCGTRTPTRS